jgi:DNA-binding response OmpR family regulator
MQLSHAVGVVVIYRIISKPVEKTTTSDYTYPMKVLVVEDTVKLARLIASGLETEGFLVDVFNNGTKALERILAFPDTYSCIILDLSLPGKDGVEICREARAQGVHTPIIVVTARDAIGEKVQLLDYGADDYMTKPFAFEELVARVKAVLRRPPQRNANTATVGRLTINKDAQTVTFYDEEVPLSQGISPSSVPRQTPERRGITRRAPRWCLEL